MDSTKRCVRCEQVKPHEAFNRRSSAKDGRASWCKECQHAYHKNWKRENPAKVKKNAKLYYARHKPVLNEKTSHWYQENKERHKALVRAWQDRNPERELAKFKRYRERHPELLKQRRQERTARGLRRIESLVRRARVYRATLPGAEVGIDTLLGRFAVHGWRCYYCRTPVSAATVEAEHRIPLARGGLHCGANIVPACAVCNRKKGVRTEREFRLGVRASRDRPAPICLRATLDVPKAVGGDLLS